MERNDVFFTVNVHVWQWKKDPLNYDFYLKIINLSFLFFNFFLLKRNNYQALLKTTRREIDERLEVQLKVILCQKKRKMREICFFRFSWLKNKSHFLLFMRVAMVTRCFVMFLIAGFSERNSRRWITIFRSLT